MFSIRWFFCDRFVSACFFLETSTYKVFEILCNQCNFQIHKLTPGKLPPPRKMPPGNYLFLKLIPEKSPKEHCTPEHCPLLIIPRKVLPTEKLFHNFSRPLKIISTKATPGKVALRKENYLFAPEFFLM